MNKEIKSYKLLDTNFPPNPPIKDAKLYVLNQSTQKVETYITDMFGTPKPLKDDTGGGGSGTYTFFSSDNSITISGTNNVSLILESSLKALINSALQSGDNISELNNDENYITLGDIPVFDPSNYDLTEFTNVDADPFVRMSDLVGVGATNLTYTASPTQGTVNSDTGTDAVIPLADGTNAGLITPAEKILVSTALQSGDNISELTNDEGFITLADVPTEVNDLTVAVVWANVPDVNITESSVTQHEAALTITESQISDLNHFTPTDLPTDYGITLGTVAISNDYNDLDNLPSLTNGTVTSVAVSGSDGIEVDSGSPITTSGTIALGLNKTTTLAFLNVEDGAQVNTVDSVNGQTGAVVLTEKNIKGTKLTATVSGTSDIDLNADSDFHLTMLADTAFTFINTPTGAEVRRCKIRLTGEFVPSWTQAGLNTFGDAYDGTKWNDILVEMWLDGTIKGLLIYQQRETA